MSFLDVRCDVCLDNDWRLCKKCPHTEKVDKKKLNIFNCKRCRITKLCDKHMDCALDVFLEGVKKGKTKNKTCWTCKQSCNDKHKLMTDQKKKVYLCNKCYQKLPTEA